MVFRYKLFETKPLDFLVLIDCVHYDFGVNTFYVGLGGMLLFLSGLFFGLEARRDDFVDEMMGLVGELWLGIDGFGVGKSG